MDSAAIELYIRRAADLPTLRAIQQALGELGEPCALRRAPELDAPSLRSIPAGTSAGALHVIVEAAPEPGAAGATPAPSEDRVGRDADRGDREAIVWEDCALPAQSFSDVAQLARLSRARCVAVPGPAHALFLASRISGQVLACGIARLDPILTDFEHARARARLGLGVPRDRSLVLFAPSSRRGCSALEQVGDRVTELCAPGRILAILASGWPADWLEWQRRIAASRPDLMLVEPRDAVELIPAADAIVGDPGELLWQAYALGVPVVALDRGPIPAPGFDARARDLGGLVRSLNDVLARGRVQLSEERRDLLERSDSAARRIARLLRSALHAEPEDAPAAAPRVTLAAIEAQAAFGEVDAARRALRDRIASDPQADACVLLASLERKHGQLEAAEEAAVRALELGRTAVAKALCETARLAVERGDHAGARSYFEQAHGQLASLPDPLVGLGSLSLHAGDAAASEQLFRTALQLEKSGRTWSGLGLALAALGRTRDALAALEAALDLDPECHAALYGLVQTSFQLGELSVAAERLRRFVEAHPGNLGFSFTLAGLLCELGERAEALELVGRIELFDPQYPGLAELRVKLGE